MQDFPHFTKALETAQKGGYRVFYSEEMSMYLDAENDRLFTQKEIWSDRRFWVAIGEAKGWETSTQISSNAPERLVGEWLDNWHNFIDHLADEKDSEDFFEEMNDE